MDDGQPAWARRIREERQRRLWSQKTCAARLRDAADDRTRAQLPSVENIQRRVRGHESGQHYPGDLYAELYCRAFGLTRESLFGTTTARPGREFPEIAAGGDIAALTTWITATNTTDDAIARIDLARADLAEAHTQLPPSCVLADVLGLHRQVQSLLQGGRQRTRQTRELFRIDADLLAHASLLFDDIQQAATAQKHGETAAICAEEAGCSPALAFSAQAKTARWRGAQLGRARGASLFARSADLAHAGFNCSPQLPVRVLLACQEASAAALLGDTKRAGHALHLAEDAAAALPDNDTGLSTWSCPMPRMALYTLSVALRFREPGEALRAARTADQAWASGAPWLHGVWALTRIGAATAHLMTGDLDAAAGELRPVLTLAPPLRIATITSYLTDMDNLLGQPRFRAIPAARDMRDTVAAFTAAAAPGAASVAVFSLHRGER